MANFSKSVQVEVLDGKLLNEATLEVSVSKLVQLHIDADCGLLGDPEVNIYRTIKLQDGCEMDDHCYFYGSTCDTLVLPSGEYELEVCLGVAERYQPDGTFNINFIFEELTPEHVTALQLNSTE